MAEVPASWLEEMAAIAAKKMGPGNIPVREGGIISDQTHNALWTPGTPPTVIASQVYLCFGKRVERDPLPVLYAISRQKYGGWWDIRGRERTHAWTCICHMPIVMPLNWTEYTQ